ncbi:hypothetical protein [Parvicella tangerina]|uniref:Uncharacterized protein n=1 Tax=Parvicella tangerina TaxID=2829795 RepID=A0A916JRD1_9FLAO|nr:hypothetical protein [Parvicella tangerina]CAG5085855.1 hypothetical protein CRYO30217_02910 [Parvicella tangerina]
MDYFKYVFYLGIVYVVFSLIWFFIAQGLKLILRSGREEQPWEGYVLKSIQYYFIASLTLLKAEEYVSSKVDMDINSALLFVLGGIVLYLYLYGKYERTKQFAGFKATFAMMKNGKVSTTSTADRTKYEPHIIGVTTLFYLIALQFPVLIDHKLNLWFLTNINDFYDTFLIKWILGIIGFFFMISMVIKGISATGELIQVVIGLITGKPHQKKQPKNPFENMGNFGPFGEMNKNNPFGQQQAPQQDQEEEEVDLEGEYVDFEVVDDEDEDEEDKNN